MKHINSLTFSMNLTFICYILVHSVLTLKENNKFKNKFKMLDI